MATAIGQYKGKDIFAGDQSNIQSQMKTIDSTPASSTPTLSTNTKTNRTNASGGLTMNADELTTPPSKIPDLTPAPFTATTDAGVNTALGNAQSAMTANPPVADTRTTIQNEILKMLGKDDTAEKDKIRLDAQVAEKKQRANEFYNKTLAKKRTYEDEIQILKKNQQGVVGTGALNSIINERMEQQSRELADDAITYSIINDDYQTAESLVTQRINDLETRDANRLALLKTAYDFVQNDMTESEKFKAQQAFQEKQAELEFNRSKELARYNSMLNREEASYRAGLDANVKAAEQLVVSQQAQTEALTNYNTVNELLNSGQVENVVGINRLNPFNYIPGTKVQYAKNQFNQIKNMLSLDSREKLKGSGAVSDFESKMLASAASALGTNINNDDALRELAKVKGAFANAAGLPAKVKITDQSNGNSTTVLATRDTINQAIADGALVEYQP